MVKKYKLVSSNSSKQLKQDGGSFAIMHPAAGHSPNLVIPPFMHPFIPPFMVPNIGNSLYVNKIALPVFAGSDTTRISVPVMINPPGPGDFYAQVSDSDTEKSLTADSVVRMTYREPAPQQLLMTQSPIGLPYLPTSRDYGIPARISYGHPIIINPEESKANLVLTSTDSDDIVTISGEQDKIKPVYDRIKFMNELKDLDDKITLSTKMVAAADDVFYVAIETAFPPPAAAPVAGSGTSAPPAAISTAPVATAAATGPAHFTAFKPYEKSRDAFIIFLSAKDAATKITLAACKKEYEDALAKLDAQIKTDIALVSAEKKTAFNTAWAKYKSVNKTNIDLIRRRLDLLTKNKTDDPDTFDMYELMADNHAKLKEVIANAGITDDSDYTIKTTKQPKRSGVLFGYPMPPFGIPPSFY